jgi:hypothetical protein
MALAPIRPRFRLSLPGDPMAHLERTRAALDRPEHRLITRVLANHLDVTLTPEDRKRWSPCVHLEFEDEEGGTRVQGLIGPHPNVWTFYAVVSAHFALGAAFALVFGLVQLSLDESPWALWVALICALLLVVMYALSQIGQRLARDQTEHLSRLVEEALGAPLHAADGASG